MILQGENVKIRMDAVGVLAPMRPNHNLLYRSKIMDKTILTDSQSKTNQCSFDGCDKPRKGFGYCQNHYRRFKKHGDPKVALKVRATTLLDAFNAYLPTDKPDNECWEWQGSTSQNYEYGVVYFQYKALAAHRVAYFLHHGHWPEPMALHSCDNHACVNPQHIRAGTHIENMQDAKNRGKLVRGTKPTDQQFMRGENCPQSILLDADVYMIKKEIMQGISLAKIARKWGVVHSTISKIRHNVNWAHIPWPNSNAIPVK